jgi:hypothetical protein
MLVSGNGGFQSSNAQESIPTAVVVGTVIAACAVVVIVIGIGFAVKYKRRSRLMKAMVQMQTKGVDGVTMQVSSRS